MLKDKVTLIVGETKRALGKGRNHGRQPLDENSLWTGGIAADELAEAKTETDGDTRPGSISKCAAIMSMNAG